ncbi:MAG TPA: diaminobutyrate acetyltransferase [Pseudonocardiaceae bacterium]|nr:diaminobutyrate acetyltransferase [Pseudonocardiaceae bacterium]
MVGDRARAARETPLLRFLGMSGTQDDLVIDHPESQDGAALWKLARDSGELDVNSSYAYLLWCRDFRETTVVAKLNGEAVGFITAYRRPDDPATLLVWQVAVAEAGRNKGIASAMLDALLRKHTQGGVRFLETTVTEANIPSNKMFRSLAARWNAPFDRSELFTANEFPDGHDPEFLYRIGPLEPIHDELLV